MRHLSAGQRLWNAENRTGFYDPSAQAEQRARRDAVRVDDLTADDYGAEAGPLAPPPPGQPARRDGWRCDALPADKQGAEAAPRHPPRPDVLPGGGAAGPARHEVGGEVDVVPLARHAVRRAEPPQPLEPSGTQAGL